MAELLPLDKQNVSTLLAVVAEQREALLALTHDLVACRTDSQFAQNPEFEPEAQRCQSIVAAWLAESGASVERWQEPPRYPVVAGKLAGAGGGRSLAFNGHVDVVPVGDDSAWTHDPWGGEADAGRLWGRGAADMKGGVACALVAMRALHDSGIRLAGDVWAHVVADEEVVGQSSRNLLRRLPPVDAVLVAEPTDLTIMPVEGGLVHFRIEIDGRESHAGNRYRSVHAGGHGDRAGVNAIEKGDAHRRRLTGFGTPMGQPAATPAPPARFQHHHARDHLRRSGRRRRRSAQSRLQPRHRSQLLLD